jgi:hypothetical protein
LGSPHADTLNGSGLANTLLGGAGDDAISGGGGLDLLQGGDGNDSLGGDGDADTVQGDSGDDSVDGGAGEDLLAGGSGNDTVTGGADADSLNAGTGADTLKSRDGVVDIVTCGTDADPDKTEADASDKLSGDCALTAVEAAFVSISGRAVRIARNGTVAVMVSCRRAAAACAGALTLETSGKVRTAARRRPKPRKLRLGSSRFSIPAGKTSTVKVRVSKAVRRVIKKRGSVRVSARATGKGARPISATFTVRAAAKKGRRK